MSAAGDVAILFALGAKEDELDLIFRRLRGHRMDGTATEIVATVKAAIADVRTDPPAPMTVAEAGAAGRRIVREGMADVLAWLDGKEATP